MEREISLGDIFVDVSDNTLLLYTSIMNDHEYIEYKYRLQDLDGKSWWDSWMTEDDAEQELSKLVSEGKFEHYTDYSITLKREKIVIDEKTVGRNMSMR